MSSPKAWLTPEHFRKTYFVRISKAFGLHGEVLIGDEERRDAALWYDFDDPRFQRFASRSPTRIVINPKTLPLPRLRARLDEAKGHGELNEINVGYGLPKAGAYDQTWHVEDANDNLVETQHVVFVAFRGKSPVGYAGVRIFIDHIAAREAEFRIEPLMVYVDPGHRGEGFGLDLSIATGWVATDLLHALYRAVPEHSTIACYVCAEYESNGGEAFTQQIVAELEVSSDTLCAPPKRRTVRIECVDLDAGY
jgi:hypothetical protein